MPNKSVEMPHLLKQASKTLVSPAGIINLKASKTHKNKFERGMTDEFTVEAVDIGLLKKLRIGHDNCGTLGRTS